MYNLNTRVYTTIKALNTHVSWKNNALQTYINEWLLLKLQAPKATHTQLYHKQLPAAPQKYKPH